VAVFFWQAEALLQAYAPIAHELTALLLLLHRLYR